MRAGLLECDRAPLTDVPGLRTVKSLAVLSVNDKSSGNSAATMPHNSRGTTARSSIFPNLVRTDGIVKPVSELIHLYSEMIGSDKFRGREFAGGSTGCGREFEVFS